MLRHLQRTTCAHSFFLPVAVVAALVWTAGPLFGLRVSGDLSDVWTWTVHAKIQFSKRGFAQFLPRAMMLGVLMGAANLAGACATAVRDALQS